MFGETVPGSVAEGERRGTDAVAVCGVAVHGVGARARDEGGIWVWELDEVGGDVSFDPLSLTGPGGFGVCRGEWGWWWWLRERKR